MSPNGHPVALVRVGLYQYLLVTKYRYLASWLNYLPV